MRRLTFTHIIIIILVILSAVFFILQQLLFHDMHESGFLFFQDLMFLPIHLILVTFILDRILHSREKRERLEQMDIVIGAFFSEMGTIVLKTLNEYISNVDDVKAQLDMQSSWDSKKFDHEAKMIKNYTFEVDSNTSLKDLKSVLPDKKAYLLEMFNNPNLLEHDSFTDMLWALYHLIDELENRHDINALPGTDVKHLSGDIVRAYSALLYQWILYMKHLKTKYPYLWSLAVRKNPFAENDIIISQ